MKASELIARLQERVEKHGDLPIIVGEEREVSGVDVFDADGNTPEVSGKAPTEVYLWTSWRTTP